MLDRETDRGTEKGGEMGMKQEEWMYKSNDWKNGYLAFVNNYVISYPDKMSKEWWLGFDYACRYAKSDKQNGEFPFVCFSKKDGYKNEAD